MTELQQYLYAFFMSMLPIVELRGGLPLAVTAFGLPLVPSYIVCVLGNILPVPFLLLFARAVLHWCMKLPKIGHLFQKIVAKGEEKAKKIGKWELLGLLGFVAIPLPGTGAWTGCLIAVVLSLKPLPSFIVISLGVLIAGIIMGFASFGLLEILTAMVA